MQLLIAGISWICNQSRLLQIRSLIWYKKNKESRLFTSIKEKLKSVQYRI